MSVLGQPSTHQIVSFDTLLDLGMQSPIRGWRRIPGDEEWELAPPRFGLDSLARFGVEDGWPLRPRSGTSAVCTLHSVRLHSCAGIVITEDGQAIAETLAGSRPERDGYRMPGEARITLPAPTGRLQGTWLSLLLGGPRDDYSVLLLNLARLALLTPTQLAGLDGVLLPADLDPLHRAAAEAALHLAFGPAGAPGRLKLLLVEPGEGLDVERLLLPWHIGEGEWLNPLAARFLRPLSLPGAPEVGEGRRIYIDGRGQAEQTLLNEEPMVTAMRRLGIEPVRLEGLGFGDIVGLFSQSELIVGASKTGLAHVVFAAPGATLIEIRPHLRSGWRTRTLAAAAGLTYDCVLGRSEPVSDAAPDEWPCSVASEDLEAALTWHLAQDFAA